MRHRLITVLSVYVTSMCCPFSDNKKGSIPSEKTSKDRGNCWPSASHPPWLRLHLQVWSKTNAKARRMEQRVKRMMFLLFCTSASTACIVTVELRLVLCPCRLSQAEYHEQEEIFKLRLGHLKKVTIDMLSVSQSMIRLHV